MAPPHAERGADISAASGIGSLIVSGTPAFRNTILAMFSAGFATFALLYHVQPLLPVFSDDFGLGAAQSSLALSVTTGLMAPAMLVASAISENVGRKPVMVAAVIGSALLTCATSLAPSWPALLALRALTGLALACLPAVAMAYVAEEIAPSSIGAFKSSCLRVRSAAMKLAQLFPKSSPEGPGCCSLPRKL